MIIPPEPEHLRLLREAVKYPPHLIRLLPALHHSDMWAMLVETIGAARDAAQEYYDQHKERLNERKARDEEE